MNDDRGDARRIGRLELVLRKLEYLPPAPPLSTVWRRSIESGARDTTELIELVRVDPALTAKALSVCQRVGARSYLPVLTVGRAVELLGASAVREVLLPYAAADESAGAAPRQEAQRHSTRAGLWRHSLAVAIAAELIAAAHRDTVGIDPAEAFTAGLLHDLGKLALDHLLPRSYGRVVEIAGREQIDIAEVERQVIGMDHHTAGKRLAELWRLPHVLQDCIWLHGSPAAALPKLPHTPLIMLVGVADLLARRKNIGYSGNFTAPESLERQAGDAGLDPRHVAAIGERLSAEVEQRLSTMAIDLELDAPSAPPVPSGHPPAEGARDVDPITAPASPVFDAICDFHLHTTEPATGVHDVLDAVARSAASALDVAHDALIYQDELSRSWLLCEYIGDARAVEQRYIDPPAGAERLSNWRSGEPGGPGLVWLSRHMHESANVSGLQCLALPCGWGTVAVLLHPPPRVNLDAPGLRALSHTWGAALAAAAQHQGARRLGEQLVQAHRQLAEAQGKLVDSQSRARLGEAAAGAAHEMNNPLAVISGRVQLLMSRLPAGSPERSDAEQVWRQAHKLSDLITALGLFAQPLKPRFTHANPAEIVQEALRLAREAMPDAPAVLVSGLDGLPPLWTDRDQLAAALSELLLNALQSQPKTPVRMIATVDPINNRSILRVIDDGIGMDGATLEHAFEPFFSAKPAGRQTGLGLAKARRFVEGLGGEVRLISQPDQGTTAIVTVPLDARGS